jgi:hypothetical protein
MSLWGRNDNKGSGGTVTLNYATGIVTGTGTTFGNVGAAATGDVIRFGIRGGGGTYFGDAIIVGIASTTQLSIASTTGLSGAAIAATSFYISELPKYTVLDYSYSNKLDAAQTLTNLGITGTASTNANVGVSTVSVGSTANIIVGDTLLNGGSDIRITSIGTNTISLASTISTGIATGATLTFKRFVGGYDKQVYGISTSGVAAAYRGYTHQGWVGVQTYTDTHGNLRVKTEVLVAMSGITTGVDSINYPTAR